MNHLLSVKPNVKEDVNGYYCPDCMNNCVGGCLWGCQGCENGCKGGCIAISG